MPALFLHMFPSWFVGVAFAAIAIGALVPAAIMSIACGNLFTRNIYREFIDPGCSPPAASSRWRASSRCWSRWARCFVILLPQAYAIQLQLLGGIWISQTLPSVLIGLYMCGSIPTRSSRLGRRHRGRHGAGRREGLRQCDLPLQIFGWTIPCYDAVSSLLLNLAVSIVLSAVFNALWRAPRVDATKAGDYI